MKYIIAMVAAVAAGWSAQAQPVAEQPLTRTTLAEHASWYQRMYSDAEHFETARFAAAADLDAALHAVASHDPDAVATGWTAAAALTAVMTTDFVAGVRRAADVYGAQAVADGLRRDPRYAGTLSGGVTARSAIVQLTAGDAETIRAAAARVESQSFSMQKEDWAQVAHAAPESRVATLEQAGETRVAPGAAHVRRVAHRASEYARRDEQPGWRQFLSAAAFASTEATTATEPRRTHVGAVDGALTLAALTVLEDATRTDLASYASRQVRRCAVLAQLHVYECAAAARYPFEDAYCVARHGLRDHAGCVDAAG